MFFVFSLFVTAFVTFLVFLVLFEPGLAYKVLSPGLPLDSDEFMRLIGALADAQLYPNSTYEVLTDAPAFYEAELAAIAGAERSINLEAYIFRDGRVGRRFLDALSERARAGVKVKLVLDAYGNFFTRDALFRELRAAGGRVHWYQPLRWYTFKSLNNRTHRELLVIDGEAGFIGGAGVSDWWVGEGGEPPWRDTVVRVRGEAARGLQTAFAENWLESSGEILVGREYFPDCALPEGAAAGAPAMVVISTPSAARSSRARVLFQTLLASSTASVRINSPYFVPDKSTRGEICAAAKRGVRVRIITPDARNNHPMTRYTGRGVYGEMLAAGVEIYEYEPSMIHAKTLVVDDLWCVVGSTNFDNRSFGLNDEVNLATPDRALAARLGADFERDLARSRRVSEAEWRRRSLVERALGFSGRALRRQL